MKKPFVPYISICIAAFFSFQCGDQRQNTESVVRQEDIKKDTPVPAAVPFKKVVHYKQVECTVTSPGIANGNSFTLVPKGLTIINDTFTNAIDGLVHDVVIDDIDGDDAPEVAVLTRSGENETGTAYVFSSNKNKSMSSVNFPAILPADTLLMGYKGHDEFNFVEGSFIRRFPLYNNDSATGKMRQFQYKLKPGEALKQLVLYRTVEY